MNVQTQAAAFRIFIVTNYESRYASAAHDALKPWPDSRMPIRGLARVADIGKVRTK